MNRRHFIKKSTLGLISGGILSRTGVSHTQKEVEADSPRIKEYRTLGRTGFKVSDLGTGDFDDANRDPNPATNGTVIDGGASVVVCNGPGALSSLAVRNGGAILKGGVVLKLVIAVSKR